MINILLLQLPVPNNPGANIPLAAGYLKAWAAKQGLLERAAIEIMPRDLADRAGDALLVKAIVARRPDVLGISLYTWNSERSLLIAGMAKAALPELIVVVGGPEVQRNNDWVLRHPAVDIAVEGEGEQTFAELIERLAPPPTTDAPGARSRMDAASLIALHGETIAMEREAIGATAAIDVAQTTIPLLGLGGDPTLVPGAIERRGAELLFGAPRVALASLDVVPSPYLLGFLELRPGEMALIECSRWCPYGCTFCLYGRSMGAKLGGRLFGAGRVLAEVAWARERGAGAIHFVEANLNLLPNFRELMAGLRAINTGGVPIYAELRGEHLKDEVVAALVDAGLRTAEVGLQSANRAALQAVGRRTDLDKWAAGTRRLYARGVEVLLDVILGLPEDDRDTTLATIDWINEQGLGPYDIFTLQVLPGTGIRSEAERYGLRYQDRPPYYVLATHRLSYGELRGLRWELREAAGLDPQVVEGLPEPAAAAWNRALAKPVPALMVGTPWGHASWLIPYDREPAAALPPVETFGSPIDTLALDCAASLTREEWAARGSELADQVASHVVVIATHADLAAIESLCWPIAEANPSIHWDIICDDPRLAAAALRDLTARWPHAIGYLDRIAVYRRIHPEPDWHKVTPRWWVLADRAWSDAVDPLRFEGVAEVVWRTTAAELADESAGAGNVPGGYGIVIAGELDAALRQEFEERDVRVLNL